MTSAGLDLKNPGGKETVVVAGAALGLGLIYFAFSKKKTAGESAPAPSSPPANVTVEGAPLTGGGMRVTGGPFTGNAFTDANVSALLAPPPVSVAGGPVRGGPPPRMPVLHVVQGAQEILGSGSPTALNAGVPAPPGGGGTVSGGAAGVYHALIRAGLLPFQAAGVMGNIQNESSFNTQAIGDQGTSFGLIQWHNTTYPNASGYVTGNVAKDFQNQITGIVQLFKQHSIGGTTAGQVGGNWASQIEGCVGCQPGGSQYSQRVANAQAIYQQIVRGAFTPPKPKPAAGVKPATAAQIRRLFPIVKPGGPRRPPTRRSGPAFSTRAYDAFLSVIRATPRRGPGHPLYR